MCHRGSIVCQDFLSAMNTILCLPISIPWLLTLSLCTTTVRSSDDRILEGEGLGKITIGQKADQLTALLGKPESKGKDVLWEATGDWVQEWSFPAKGLKLNMASGKKGGSKEVLTITASSPCNLATKRGIRIGSTVAETARAYRDVQDKDQSEKGKTFVAGSVYGGVIFTFKADKVSEIFVGAAAE